MPPLDAFNPGLAAYPDRSATLIVQAEFLLPGVGVRLRGPGIEGMAALNAAPLPGGFWEQARRNHRLYPRGVDVILAAPWALAALPRSTAVEA
jgi:alpha-D-ribose 1-methylphosphonate 5-triphosphate synthase subunit PhnH